MSTTEKQALQAQKVAQKVAEYHSKLAATSKIGLFSKLDPKIRGKIYASLFENVLQPEESDTPCPCRLTPGEYGHSGSYVYKPLKHLRPFLALLATCKLFRNEAQALLYVDYTPKTAWVVRGKDGPEQLRDFLRCIRPQQPEKMLFAWRLEDVVVDSVQVKDDYKYRMIRGAADWLSYAINRHDHVRGEEEKAEKKAREARRQRHLQGKFSPSPQGLSYEEILDAAELRQKRFYMQYSAERPGGYSTRRFYIGHKHHSSGDRETVVVNGPLQRLFWKPWEIEEMREESEKQYERIVSM
jgi:hypothetical protein